MSITKDLEEKLDTAMNSVEAAVSELNSYSDMRKSLQSADQGLNETVDKMDELSKTLRQASTNLGLSAHSINEAAELIKKTEPTKILTAVTDLKQDTQKSLSEILPAVTDLKQDTQKSLSELTPKIERKIKGSLRPVILLTVVNLIMLGSWIFYSLSKQGL